VAKWSVGLRLRHRRRKRWLSDRSKRLVGLKDIAALAVFLASDAAKSISGQMMSIDNDMQQAS
jgi:enoyl-[acyl-carrier-protein] reductase (NADH)